MWFWEPTGEKTLRCVISVSSLVSEDDDNEGETGGCSLLFNSTHEKLERVTFLHRTLCSLWIKYPELRHVIIFPECINELHRRKLLSQWQSLQCPGSSQHALQGGPHQHASSLWKSSQVERPIHSKLTLTAFDWIPLPLAVSLLVWRDGRAPTHPPPPLLLLLLHLSFTSADWHVRSMCFLFLLWEVFLSLFSCLSRSILFISSLGFSLPLSLFSFFLSSTTGWRYLIRSKDSCLCPSPPSLHTSCCFLSFSLSILPPLKDGDVCCRQLQTK